MSTGVHYLCPHTTPISSLPPHRGLCLSSLLGIHYHPLSALLFCEECDAIRCDQCVSCELNCYYCPNCLFEVPSANIRVQRNRCGRNCFLCPQCQNTLSAVATDPPSSAFQDDYRSPEASVGEPPYFLSCTFCRWDSKEVGISFEKPTFLAQQLHHAESSPAELLEFDHLRDHFEVFLKSQSLPSPVSAIHHHAPRSIAQASPGSSAQLAASLALSKEVPNVTRFGTQLGLPSSVFKIRSANSLIHSSTLPANLNPNGTWREDLKVYEALLPVGGSRKPNSDSAPSREEARLAFCRHGDDDDSALGGGLLIEKFAPLEKKWDQIWDSHDRTADLKPVGVPLRSKRTKRCPTCQHILIKPEQKAQSIRFKIKLIASNYLPLIELNRKRLASSAKHLVADRLTSGMSAARKSAAASRAGTSAGSNPLLGRTGEVPDEVIRPDRKYQFELTFVNPLYEPINVRLSIPQPAAEPESDPEVEPTAPYNIHLLASEFTIAAFAEVWEYDDDDEAEGGGNEHADDLSEMDDGGNGKRNRLSTFGLTDSVRRRTLQTNAVTKKANRTSVLLEAKTSKQFVGTLQADMLVTFTYRSDELDDELDDSSHAHLHRKKSTLMDEDEEDENQKSFTFWTKLTFGEVVPMPALQSSGSSGPGGNAKKKKPSSSVAG